MTHTVTFEKVVSEGKALAYWKDKALFAIGPLPGETAIVEVTREKPRWAEATVREITTTSKHRQPALEQHYMSCSPWQGVEYAYQLELKRAMLAEIYARPGLKLKVRDFVASEQALGYRNKLEFVFVPNEAGVLELALHERGSEKDFVMTPEGCVLGSEAMNKATQLVVEQVNKLNLTKLADTLVVRSSQTSGEVTVVLTLKARARRDWQSLRVAKVAGTAVVCKTPNGGTEFMWGSGELRLAETVDGLQINYPWDAFSQANLPVFSKALDQILTFIQPETKVVDLYGGVGAIGLPIAKIAGEVVGVEVLASAVGGAVQNAKLNKLANYRAHLAPAEGLDPHVLEGVYTIVVDPPRAGLDPKVVQLMLAASPRQIIYLSCNPVTQARDIMLLSEAYKPSNVTGFDFYPGTLHLESLVILTRR